MIAATANFTNANASKQVDLVHLLSIAGYSKVFTETATGVAGQYPWISKIGKLSQKVNDLEGTSTLSDLDVTVIDRTGALLADFAGFTFEGAVATLKTGFANMASQADFATLATMVISKVDSAENNTAFTFHLTDNSRLLQHYIYTTGDNGYPISSANPRTVLGNPMAILTDVLQNQLGLAAGQINSSVITAYQNTLFAGIKLKFLLTKAEKAKDFLDADIFKAFGGYMFQNYQGKFTPFFYVPNQALSYAASIGATLPISVLVPVELDFLNEVNVRMDYDGSKFGYELLEIYGPSIAKYNVRGQQQIDSRGARVRWGGWTYARLLAHTLFLRYGSFPLSVKTTAKWNPAVVFEVGDYLQVTSTNIPNRATGKMGITNEAFEILSVVKDLEKGTVDLELLDVGWQGLLGAFQVAPDGELAYPSAPPADQARYQFVCSAATGQYSNGAAGNPIL